MLTDAQLDRYARHIVLKEIGGEGQAKLLAARVLVIGAGGLGAPLLMYLAAAGVGALGIVDDDAVALDNLQRQIIHDTASIGRPKTDSAAASIARINPDVAVVKHPMRLDAGNAADLIGGYDLVADGCDNFATRLAVADACLALRKTLVSGAVGAFDGQLATFKGHLADLPCYRCWVPEAPPGEEESCSERGVIGALTGAVGAMQALEAIKEITGAGTSLAGRILLYDALSARIRTIRLPKDPACPACAAR